MSADSAIDVSAVSHRYGSRTAVDGLSLSVASGEIFVFLGPNGSGKTTLFRVLSTLIPLQSGEITILGYSLRTNAAAIRSRLGVVFQAPSLDKKLTVAENLHHQGKLYGLGGPTLAKSLRRNAHGARHRRQGRGDHRKTFRRACAVAWNSPRDCCIARSCYCLMNLRPVSTRELVLICGSICSRFARPMA